MSEYTPAMVERFKELVKVGRIHGMTLLADGKIGLQKGSVLEMKAQKCAPGEKALVGDLKKHPEISNPFALAKWMKKHGKIKKVQLAEKQATGRWVMYRGRRIFIGPGLRGFGGKKRGSSGAGRGLSKASTAKTSHRFVEGGV